MELFIFVRIEAPEPNYIKNSNYHFLNQQNYLNQNLLELAGKLGRTFLFTNYVSDENDVISVIKSGNAFSIPEEIKNKYDWNLFQQLLAQTEALITTKSYIDLYNRKNTQIQDILTQFEEKGEFSELGKWRISKGLKRSPDLIILTRSFDFTIPDDISKSGRQILILSGEKQLRSASARKMSLANIKLLSAGKNGVEGRILFEILNRLKYKVVKMTSGPAIFNIMLKTDILDRIYHTVVKRRIPEENYAEVLTILENNKVENLNNFTLIDKFRQEKVQMADGKICAQEFLIYNNIRLINNLSYKK